jgi:hypothetical protein
VLKASERPHQHGRARPLDGPFLHRTALAVADVGTDDTSSMFQACKTCGKQHAIL